MSFSSYHLGGSVLGLRSMRSGALQKISSGGLPMLKSGSLTKNRSSAVSGSSLSLDAIRDAVSQIIQTDVSDSKVDNKVSGGLTEEYVDALETQAREDAQAGVYGKDGKAAELREEQMKKYISPDRDSAIAQANQFLVSGALGSTGANTVKLSGLPYTVSISKGMFGITAEIYDENGEKFASYDSGSGGWNSVATKAESQFVTASSSVYDEAYRAEEARLGGSANSGASSSLNLRV